MKTIKNKQIPVKMITGIENPKAIQGIAIVSNDKLGKTLTLSSGIKQMTIAFGQIEKYLR